MVRFRSLLECTLRVYAPTHAWRFCCSCATEEAPKITPSPQLASSNEWCMSHLPDTNSARARGSEEGREGGREEERAGQRPVRGILHSDRTALARLASTIQTAQCPQVRRVPVTTPQKTITVMISEIPGDSNTKMIGTHWGKKHRAVYSAPIFIGPAWAGSNRPPS